MKYSFKSFLLSTITVDDEYLTYKISGKSDSIAIKNIVYLDYRAAKIFSNGYLFIRDQNNQKHRIPYDEKNNSKVKAFIEEMNIKNETSDYIEPLPFKESLACYYSKSSDNEDETAENKVEKGKNNTVQLGIEKNAESAVPKEDNKKQEIKEHVDIKKEPEVEDMPPVIENTETSVQKTKKKTFGERFQGFNDKMDEVYMKYPHIFTLKYVGGHPLITSEGDSSLIIKNGVATLRKGFNIVQIKDIKAVRYESEEEIKSRYTATRIAFLGIFALAFKKKKKIQHKFLVIECSYEGMDCAVIFTGKEAQKAHGTLLEIISYYKKKEMEKIKQEEKKKSAEAKANVSSAKPLETKTATSKTDDLMNLKSLLDEGLLTKEEFHEAKKEILNR